MHIALYFINLKWKYTMKAAQMLFKHLHLSSGLCLRVVY